MVPTRRLLQWASRASPGRPLPYGAFDFRQAYLEWETPVGVLRVGQQAFNLGLGIVANGGPRPSSATTATATSSTAWPSRRDPAARASDWVVALAGDLVYRDRLVHWLVDGDIALQGVLTVFYQDHACRQDCEHKSGRRARHVPRHLVGQRVDAAGGARRRVRALGWPQPDRVGRVFAGVEVAGAYGVTDATRTAEYAEHTVLQFGGAAEFGIERDGRYRISLEAGYATGDRNPVDGDQRRFTLQPVAPGGAPDVPRGDRVADGAERGDRERPAAHRAAAHGAFLLRRRGAVAGAAYVYPPRR